MLRKRGDRIPFRSRPHDSKRTFYPQPLPPCTVSVTSGPNVRWNAGQLVTLVLIGGIVAVCCAVLVGENGVTKLFTLRAERQRLGEQAVALLEENTALRDQITRLRTDDRFVEGLARRELGFVRSGEVVYRFHRGPKSRP